MKRLFIFGCIFFSQLAFAGEQDIQKVLDKVHEQGFYGCDKAIASMEFIPDGVKRVEARLVNEGIYKIGNTGRVAVKNKPDRDKADSVEIDIVEVDGGFSDLNSYLIRKMNNLCFGWYRGGVTNLELSCDQVLAQPMEKVIDRTGSIVWQKSDADDGHESDRILVNNGGRGCIVFGRGRGTIHSGLGEEMDSVKPVK
jgi:hypothetical protein